MSGEANGWRVDGLRGWKQGAGGRVNYLYADGVPVCEFTGANITAVNTWGPGGLLARHTNNIQAGTSANTYYAWDGLGNAAQTLDGSGNVTNTFAWDAYGKGVSTSATTDPYSGFGGQWGYYTDVETGLTLCGARFYDSNAGWWLTRDPIGYAGGSNLYGYVGGNPLSYLDPVGQGMWGVIGGALIGIGVGIVTMNPVAGMWAGFAAGTAIGAAFEHENLLQATVTGAGAALVVPDGIALAAPFLPAAGAGFAWLGGLIGLGNCFVAGTPVVMADGSTKPIEQIKSGDLVQSRAQEQVIDSNKRTGDMRRIHTATVSRVSRTFVHEQATLLRLHLSSGEAITTTPGHPFAVEGQGFVLAGRLAIGNAIVTRAGPAVKIVGIEYPIEKATVYNFEVEGTHTYYVGTTHSGLWVHNNSDEDTLRPGPFAQAYISYDSKSRTWPPGVRDLIDEFGKTYGCHTCGATTPGRFARFIPDHQPPNQFCPDGEPQALLPHCSACSVRQGGQVLKKLMGW